MTAGTMDRRHFTASLCACLAGGTLGGCAPGLSGPDGGPAPDLPPGYRPADADEKGLWLAVERQEADLKGSSALLRDPAMLAYLRDIVCRLAGAHCPEVRIYLVRSAQFNAGMAANAMMMVNSGLLLHCTNESQLAAVLGHEIGHYLRRHSLARARVAYNASNAAAFATFGLAVIGLHGGAELANTVQVGVVSAYSRDDEREADAIGIRLLAEAGYDPFEAARLWDHVAEMKRIGGEKPEKLLYEDSHPPSTERADTLRQLAEQLGRPANPPNRHLEATLPVRATLLEDELKLSQFRRTEFLFEELLAISQRRGEVLFYKGELHRRRDRAGDHDRAVRAYLDALSERGWPPETYRSLGLVYRRLGRKEDARNAFADYLKAAPGATDREMILKYIEAKG